MPSTTRFTTAEQFEKEALTIQDCLDEVTLERVRDALAVAQGMKSAEALLSSLAPITAPKVCLEVQNRTGELYFKGPLRKDSHDAWHVLLSNVVSKDPDLGLVRPQVGEDGEPVMEGFLNLELMGLERLNELSDMIEAFCGQNGHDWPRGELFKIMIDALLKGASDPESETCEMLTEAYAGIIDGVEVEQAVSKDVNIWAVFGDNTKLATTLAESAYSQEAMAEAAKGQRLRMGKTANEEKVALAACGMLLERDFRLMVEAVLGTIVAQSDPGCIDPEMMAGYINSYREGMRKNARLSVFCGERLML